MSKLTISIQKTIIKIKDELGLKNKLNRKNIIDILRKEYGISLSIKNNFIDAFLKIKELKIMYGAATIQLELLKELIQFCIDPIIYFKTVNSPLGDYKYILCLDHKMIPTVQIHSPQISILQNENYNLRLAHTIIYKSMLNTYLLNIFKNNNVVVTILKYIKCNNLFTSLYDVPDVSNKEMFNLLHNIVNFI